jgi:hypothetical protein
MTRSFKNDEYDADVKVAEMFLKKVLLQIF